MVIECVKRVNELVKRMSLLEDSIAVETKYIKGLYAKASKSMSETQHYFLNGVQASPVAKSYLLTKKGIEVVGEEMKEWNGVGSSKRRCEGSTTDILVCTVGAATLQLQGR